MPGIACRPRRSSRPTPLHRKKLSDPLSLPSSGRELEAQYVAHRGLEGERLVVLRGAAGQYVRGDVQVEFRLHDRPQARDEVRAGCCSAARTRVNSRRWTWTVIWSSWISVPDSWPGSRASRASSKPRAERHVAGVGVQQLQRQPASGRRLRSRPSSVVSLSPGWERAVPDDVEDLR